MEERVCFAKQIRKKARLNFILLAAIRKYIVLFTVTVQIKAANNSGRAI